MSQVEIGQYTYVDKMIQLYGRLQDEQSKGQDMDRAVQLAEIGYGIRFDN